MTFKAILERALDRLDGSQAKLAAALELSRPRITRVLSGRELSGDALAYPFLSTDACLALAEIAGVDPEVVLGAAQKGKTARRLNRLYGTTARAREQQLVLADLDVINGDSPAAYKRIRGVIGDMAAGARQRAYASKRRRQVQSK